MKITTFIASTTHIDRNNDKMTKECLESMAEQINSKFLPLDVNHSGNFIGGLYVAAGYYEYPEEKTQYPYQTPNTIWKHYVHLIDNSIIDYEVCIVIEKEKMNDLEEHLNNNGFNTHRIEQKALDAPTIIMISLQAIDVGINLLNLLKVYYSKHNNLNIKIRLLDRKKGKSKELLIDNADDVDINELIKDFLS